MAAKDFKDNPLLNLTELKKTLDEKGLTLSNKTWRPHKSAEGGFRY